MSSKLISLSILAVLLLIIIPCTVQAKIISISSGQEHALALNDDGTVWAWGENSDGQIGIGVMGDAQAKPQKVLINNVTAITAYGTNSLALKNDGTVWTWGCGLYGTLGYGGTESQPTPVQVFGLTNITAISHGGSNNGLALKNDGTVWTWGGNEYGELGDGTKVDKLTPVQVSGLTDIVTLSDGGSGGTYAIKKDGTVWAWGSNDYSSDCTITYGALGDMLGPGLRLTPFKVAGLNNVTQITKGYKHTVYLKDDGTVWAWGGNRYGEIGDGTIVSTVGDRSSSEEIKNTPVKLRISGIVKLSAASLHTTALKDDGTVWFWGAYLDGSPHNNEQGISAPAKINCLENVVDVCAGDQCCFALKDDGSVWGWGDNHNRALGDHNKYESKPVLIIKGSPATTPIPTTAPSAQVSTSPSSSYTTQDVTVLTTVSPTIATATPGMSFTTIAVLGCLLVTAGLLLGFVRRNSR